MTVADVCCHAAQAMGITAINLVEHTLNQKTQARPRMVLRLRPQADTGDPITFRYDVTPKSKISTLMVKDVAAGADLMNMRPTMLGALWATKLTSLPKTPAASILWEASFSHGCFTQFRF